MTHLGGLLSSWKAIGAHLGVSARTAQLWERHRGLPVHRHEGDRGRVYADPGELDRWLTAKSPAEQLSATGGSYPRWRWLVAGVALILACASLIALTLTTRVPASWRIDGETLIVTDERGRECWRHQFPYVLERHAYEEERTGLGWIGDLDGDGRREVVFAAIPKDVPALGSDLYCFSSDGTLRWHFRPGRQIADGQGLPLSDKYRIFKFAPVRKAPGQEEIAVTAAEAKYYPTQVALLSSAGRVVGEYWHSGVLTKMEVADLDNDGVPDIVLTGSANGYASATLVVLDSRELHGASAEPPRHTLQGFAPATEKLRILFPQTCLNRRFSSRNAVTELDIQRDQIGVVVTDMNNLPIFYHLTRDGRLKIATAGDSFRNGHAALYAAGELDHELSPEEEAAFGRLRYLRGGDR